VLLFIIAIFLITLGFEMMGIAIALIGLFLYPSNLSKQEELNDQYKEEREEDYREDGSYDASDGGDSRRLDHLIKRLIK
jgi:hypothetical protein